MKSPASCRAFIGGFAALPLIDAGAALAGPKPVPLPEHEARFLEIAPQIVAMCDEFDRLWPLSKEPYAAADRDCGGLHNQRPGYDRTPEWGAYIAARRPADEIGDRVSELVEPFFNLPMSAMPAILVRHRYGMTFESCREDALDDFDRMWREGRCG